MNKEPKIEVIADSISVSGNRIVTLQLTYWLNEVRQDELLTLTSETLQDYPNQRILDLIHQSTPKLLQKEVWHLPYITDSDMDLHPAYILEISAARCARVSYKLFDGADPNGLEDVYLARRLLNYEPNNTHHLTHQAVFNEETNKWVTLETYLEDIRHGRFTGFSE